MNKNRTTFMSDRVNRLDTLQKAMQKISRKRRLHGIISNRTQSRKDDDDLTGCIEYTIISTQKTNDIST